MIRRLVGGRLTLKLTLALTMAVTILPGFGSAAHAAGATPADSSGSYDPLQTFAPLTLPDPVNAYRAGNGSPGPDYWQNRADYQIHASLDPQQQRLSGDEVITYTNHSPQALQCLWIQLDQNIYRRDARSRYVRARPGPPPQAAQAAQPSFTDGYVLESVQIERGGRAIKADYLVSDTRMQIRLASPLAPRGGTLKLHIRYHYTVPGVFGGRTGHMPSRNGEIYDIAQWYPRMAVYDDLRGWDTLPYLGTEFYLEYGDFDYFVTVPWDMLVAGSGELRNPQVVLSALERARLQQARASDSTVFIRSAGEIGAAASRPARQGTLTWHFHMKQTRDVSFAASRAFIWDAARINLPGGDHALAMSFYPIESAGAGAWGRATEYLKNATENFSRRWGVYPYPAAVAVAGPVGGMEYPGIVFDTYKDTGKDLFWLTAHEIGHTWFPMMVGFDERRDQWMDEGFNTFIDVYESQDFAHGVYAPKHDQEYAPGSGAPADQIARLLQTPDLPIMLTRADQVPFRFGHPLDYFKSAFGLVLLREQILGPARFDWAFRKFISDWSYHHPTPSDFFRAMDSAGGEDLSWFWRGWYFHNWTLDLAVKDVRAVGGDWRRGAIVTIANLDPLVLPADVKIDFADGSSRSIRLPAETWIQQRSVELPLDSTLPVTAVSIDPDHLLPDQDRGNNVWKAGAANGPGT
ncbi:MAG TPA: M1 family metallopeptidase [Steroidobacteraceae bacterium]|nr:M1 family metallopeptidase [Steroidobacteraceae bacterium]